MFLRCPTGTMQKTELDLPDVASLSCVTESEKSHAHNPSCCKTCFRDTLGQSGAGGGKRSTGDTGRGGGGGKTRG